VIPPCPPYLVVKIHFPFQVPFRSCRSSVLSPCPQCLRDEIHFPFFLGVSASRR
jgi:hypothetical protein